MVLIFEIQRIASTDVLRLVVEEPVGTRLDVRTDTCHIDRDVGVALDVEDVEVRESASRPPYGCRCRLSGTE